MKKLDEMKRLKLLKIEEKGFYWLFCTKCGWILIVTEGYLLYLSNKTRLFEHKKTIWYFS